MILWTIQTEDVYQKLLQDKIYYCDINKSILCEEESFRTAYGWMSNQMKIKIPSNVKYPIWAWHSRDGKYKKPDLRQSGHAARGTKLVCIEIDVPDNEVLLSDFDKWHFVLNDFYCGDDEDLFYNLTEEQQKIEKEKSWNKIFDITEESEYIQATFWVLRLDQVRNVRHFISK
jgi:hypothetical protein